MIVRTYSGSTCSGCGGGCVSDAKVDKVFTPISRGWHKPGGRPAARCVLPRAPYRCAVGPQRPGDNSAARLLSLRAGSICVHPCQHDPRRQGTTCKGPSRSMPPCTPRSCRQDTDSRKPRKAASRPRRPPADRRAQDAAAQRPGAPNEVTSSGRGVRIAEGPPATPIQSYQWPRSSRSHRDSPAERATTHMAACLASRRHRYAPT